MCLLTKEEGSDSSRLAVKAGQRPRLAIKYPPAPDCQSKQSLDAPRQPPGIRRTERACVPLATGKREPRSHAGRSVKVDGATAAPIMATICRNCVTGSWGNCNGAASVRPPACRDRRLRRANAFMRGCAMVRARARRFRGMRRHRGEGGEQGSENLGARRMQREICRTPQAGWRLYLFRFHAEPKFRYRGSEPDAARTEANRPAIYSPSRPSAAQHRGGVRGKTAAGAVAASHLPNRD